MPLNALTAPGAQNGQMTATFAHTVSGANGLLVITVGVHSTTVASVTYFGVALTLATRTTSDDATADAEIWYLLAPATGTHNVVITMNASDNWNPVAASFTYVDQVTPVGAVASDGYTASGILTSHNTVGQTNGLIWDVFTLNGGGEPITPNGGQNTESAASADVSNWTIVTSKPGGASVSTGYSWVNDFHRWSHASISINFMDTTRIPCGPVPLQMRAFSAGLF